MKDTCFSDSSGFNKDTTRNKMLYVTEISGNINPSLLYDTGMTVRVQFVLRIREG